MKTSLVAIIIAAISFSSCRKSDLQVPESGYHRVRIYDDTLADPRNHSIHIAAGAGRLLMTYGHTLEQLSFVNGSLTLPPPAENAWMLTDNEGTLIRKDTFPSGLSVGNVISLPDNSFFIVMYTGVPNTWGGPEWTLQIMRLDPNGVMGPVSLLNVPTIHPQPFTQIYEILLLPVHNGNVLICFYYGGTDGYATFIGEMDTQGNFLWHKESESGFSMSSCLSMPGGGYMVAGGYHNPVLQKSDILIMKTNSNFDSTWSRFINIENYAMGVQIASTGNGNYWLSYSDTYSDTYGDKYIHLQEINAEGETVDSSSYPITPDLQATVMLQHGTSGIFLSHSLIISNGIESISEQFNTTYVTLDADLNITHHQSVFQDQTSDMLNSGCRTSDGKIACFGLIQSYDRRYYKPELIIIN